MKYFGQFCGVKLEQSSTAFKVSIEIKITPEQSTVMLSRDKGSALSDYLHQIVRYLTASVGNPVEITRFNVESPEKGLYFGRIILSARFFVGEEVYFPSTVSQFEKHKNKIKGAIRSIYGVPFTRKVSAKRRK